MLFQLVDMNVIKGAQRDWVQCKHFVSEAMQGNVKGNQLLWDHILLFKPWNVKWEKHKYSVNLISLKSGLAPRRVVGLGGLQT